MRRAAGFTLVELVTVMVLLGIISVAVLPRVNTEAFTVRAAADELVAALRYAQAMSMTHTGATPYRITITGSAYAVTQGGAAITHPVTLVAGYTSHWSDVSVTPAVTIDFDGYGAPICAPSCAATNVALTLRVGADTQVVTLERTTGYVR